MTEWCDVLPRGVSVSSAPRILSGIPTKIPGPSIRRSHCEGTEEVRKQPEGKSGRDPWATTSRFCTDGAASSRLPWLLNSSTAQKSAVKPEVTPEVASVSSSVRDPAAKRWRGSLVAVRSVLSKSVPRKERRRRAKGLSEAEGSALSLARASPALRSASGPPSGPSRAR